MIKIIKIFLLTCIFFIGLTLCSCNGYLDNLDENTKNPNDVPGYPPEEFLNSKKISFDSINDVLLYYETNDIMRKFNFLIINVDSFALPSTIFKHYSFNYKIENDYISNVYFEVSFAVYDSVIGDSEGRTSSDSLLDGESLWTYDAKIKFYPSELKNINLLYKHESYDNGKEMWNNIIYIYNNDNLVGEFLYFTPLSIELNYFQNIIEKNLIILKNKGE
jgi:hypothetical protein